MQVILHERSIRPHPLIKEKSRKKIAGLGGGASNHACGDRYSHLINMIHASHGAHGTKERRSSIQRIFVFGSAKIIYKGSCHSLHRHFLQQYLAHMGGTPDRCLGSCRSKSCDGAF